MKLAVSSIAWTNEEEEEVAVKLQQLGVKYVEVAPTKLWPDPTKATQNQIQEYMSFWQGYGIEIVAFQSMLFTNPNMKLFENSDNRQQTLEYLKEFTRLAGDMGAKILVFGSPKNRQRGDTRLEDADIIAGEFFKELGLHAQQHHTKFCIEPNPVDYACDYVTNTQQGIEIVREVNNPGFGLHLDIAGMTLAGDDITASISDAAELLSHFHISSPYLEQVEERDDIKHREAADALRSINYDKFVSIEMRPAVAGENVSRVEKAVLFAQQTYSS